MTLRTSRLTRAADLLDWVALYMSRRRLRTLLTAAGTCLGVAAFVAASSLTQTAAASVNAHFDKLRATELRAVPQSGRVDTATWHPADMESRLRQIDGIEHAGIISSIPDGTTLTLAALGQQSSGEQVPLVALSRGAFAAVQPDLHGRAAIGFTTGDTASRTALIGHQLADRLGVSGGLHPIQIHLDGIAFTVAGVIHTTDRRPDLMYSVAVPAGAAETIWADDLEREVLAAVEIGAADVVAQQLPVAIAPAAPDEVLVVSPVEPEQVAGTVGADVHRLSILVGAVLILVGALSIAAATYGAVNERTAEFGLRRAMGAPAAHVGALVVAEASVIGALAGAAGSAVGVVATVLVALSQAWSPVIDVIVVVVAPVGGLAVGLIAGAIPAVKATRLDPIAALRG